MSASMSERGGISSQLRGLTRALAHSAVCSSLLGVQPADAASQAFSVKDSVGIEIVTSTEPLWRPGEGWSLSERPIAKLGGPFDGEELWQVNGFLRAPDGTFIVLSAGHYEVRMFGADGRLLRRFGRVGDGPGELSAPMGLTLAPPDTVLVLDRNAIEVYLLDGTVLDPIPARQVPNAFGPGKSAIPLAVAPDRSILARVSWPRPDFLVNVPVRPPTGFGFFPGPGEPPVFVGLYDGILQESVDFGGPFTMMVVPPYARSTKFGMGPSSGARFFIADNDTYEVQVFDSDGAVRRIVRRPYTPVPVKEGWIEAWKREQQGMPWVGGQLQQLERAWSRMTVPATLPAFDALAFDSEGYLWVARSVGVPGDPVTYDVFDPDGRLLGEVAGPPGIQAIIAPSIGLDHFMALSVNAFGVESVHVYGLDRGR